MQIDYIDLNYVVMDLQNELKAINKTLKQLVTEIGGINDRLREE